MIKFGSLKIKLQSGMALDVIQIRGSLFVRTVPYNYETVTTLMREFPGYLPQSKTGQNINVAGNPIQVDDPVWSLVSQSDNTEINFIDSKIDVIITNCKVSYSEGAIGDLCSNIGKIIDKLAKALHLTASRIAISPVFVMRGFTRECMHGFVSGIFADRKFRDAGIDNCDFSNVYRVKSKIGGREITVNYLSEFRMIPMPALVNRNIVFIDGLQITFDINTYPERNYQFTEELINEFYGASAGNVIDFLNFYFPQDEHKKH